MRSAFGPEIGQRRETQEELAARGLKKAEALQSTEGAPATRWSYEELCAPVRDLPPALCFACGAEGAASACSRCGVAKYCKRECQVADWKVRHKQGCEALHSLGPSQRIADSAAARVAADALVAKMRLYAFPFAAQSLSSAGRGFVFLQVGPGPPRHAALVATARCRRSFLLGCEFPTCSRGATTPLHTACYLAHLPPLTPLSTACAVGHVVRRALSADGRPADGLLRKTPPTGEYDINVYVRVCICT